MRHKAKDWHLGGTTETPSRRATPTRHGIARMLPAGGEHVIAELDRAIDEARRAMDYVTSKGSTLVRLYIKGRHDGLVELRNRLTGTPEKPPAGIRKTFGPSDADQ